MAEYYNDYEFGDEEQEHRRPPRPQFPPDNRFMKDIGRAFLIEEDHRHHPPRPPYDMETRNRFAPENHFVGDIEDGKRYPFGVYTKEESDARYVLKDTPLPPSGIIRDFAASPSICECGSTNTILLSWELDSGVTSQNINGAPVTGTTKQYTGVSAPTAYTLTVSSGEISESKTVNVEFANNIYYGAASDITSVSGLTSILSDEKVRTITVTAEEGQYIIYAIPARLGDVALWVDGFEGGFEQPVSLMLTNSSGYTELYSVYRSTNAGLGLTTIDIREA